MAQVITLRQKELLQILTKSNHIISIRELASMMKVSSRTVRYDLKELSYILKLEKLVLSIVPSKGVFLEDANNPNWLKFLEHEALINNKIRKNSLILELLMYPKVSIISLANRFQVNRQTISRDINELIESNLHLTNNLKRTTHGIYLDLEEGQIRTMFLNEVQRNEFMEMMLNDTQIHFPLIDRKTKLWIEFLEKSYNSEFELTSRKILNTIANYLAIRSEHKQYEEIKLAGFMLSEKFDLLWDMNGCKCIERTLMTSRLARGSLPLSLESNIVDDLLTELINTLNLTIKPFDDAYLSLKLHLQAAMNRSKFNQQIENPLKDDVRLSYSILFEAISSVLSKFEEPNSITFSENEVAFIVMHIGAIIQSQSKLQSIISVAVVCQHGTATSNLLHSRLKILMPNQNLCGPYSVNEFNVQKDKLKFDLIISTIPLDENNTIIVNPLLNTKDIELIERRLWSLLYQKQCELLIKNFTTTHQISINMSQLIKENHIQFTNKFIKWEDAIEFAAKPLIQDRVINQNYITKMIWAVEALGPYMVILPKIAFVHAGNQDGVLKNGISCLRMSKPILFGNQKATEVQTIFVIASKEKEDMGLLKLVRIIENKQNYEVLLNTNDIKAIMALEG